jgi:hypothetical protein
VKIDDRTRAILDSMILGRSVRVEDVASLFEEMLADEREIRPELAEQELVERAIRRLRAKLPRQAPQAEPMEKTAQGRMFSSSSKSPKRYHDLIPIVTDTLRDDGFVKIAEIVPPSKAGLAPAGYDQVRLNDPGVIKWWGPWCAVLKHFAVLAIRGRDLLLVHISTARGGSVWKVKRELSEVHALDDRWNVTMQIWSFHGPHEDKGPNEGGFPRCPFGLGRCDVEHFAIRERTAQDSNEWPPVAVRQVASFTGGTDHIAPTT